MISWLRSWFGGRRFNGVGVFRCPLGWTVMVAGKLVPAEEHATTLAKSIGSGFVLILPADKDEAGDYLWDFRIEGGPVDQVEVRREPAEAWRE